MVWTTIKVVHATLGNCGLDMVPLTSSVLQLLTISYYISTKRFKIGIYVMKTVEITRPTEYKTFKKTVG